jgi:molybdopterin-binding protein
LFVTHLRISEAAALLGVSDDTLRRWGDAGRIRLDKDSAGRLTVDGQELANLLRTTGGSLETGPIVGRSARNRFTGIVTRVLRDGVMAQVEMQAGPFRVVSLMSREAADDLALDPGVVAVASVKSTNVVIEIPERS